MPDIQYPSLEYIFHPRSIAVVGAPSDLNVYPGYVRWLQEAGYRGSIYPVNPSITELCGLPAYRDIRDVPGPVDYVISCVRAKLAPQLIDDCAGKGVKVFHMYTARLAETGGIDEMELEREILWRARSHKMRLIGPNCLGLYYPEGGLSFLSAAPREAGVVGFMAQSGGYASETVCIGSRRGLRFSKAVSFGNAADLNECDFLEYFLQDRHTEVIGMYVEGVKDGPRFRRLLQQARGVKPVVVYKGGRTATGARAIATHTASLAGNLSVWEALFRQTGAVPVYSLEEMADALLAFSLPSPLKGRRAGCLMGDGGGASVTAADDCEQAGLIVPRLSEALKREISKFAPDTWRLINNPLDGSAAGTREVTFRAAQLLAGWGEIDVLFLVTTPTWTLDFALGEEHLASLIDAYAGIAAASGKPMVAVMSQTHVAGCGRWETVRRGHQKLVEAGCPVYPSIARAARAVSKVVGYWERIS